MFKFGRAKKAFTMIEMIIVIIIIWGLIVFLKNWNINVEVKRIPLAFPIWQNFQQITFQCPTDKGEMCNTIKLCPLSFDGLEYFPWTVGDSWEVDGEGRGWDLTNYPNLIDLSKYVVDGKAAKSSINDDEGNFKTWTTQQDILKTQSCKIQKFKSHDLHQFKHSLSKAMNEPEPTMYLINGLMYNKHFQPITWAFDHMSWTMIVNGMIYFN